MYVHVAKSIITCRNEEQMPVSTSPISCSYDPDSGGHDFDTISTAEGTKPKQTNMVTLVR